MTRHQKPALRHLLTADLDIDFIERLFNETDRIASLLLTPLGKKELRHSLNGKTARQVYWKASTRTYVSFEVAMTELGGIAQGSETVQFSSVAKGESYLDTIKTLACYQPDVLIVRSEKAGDAARAAAISPVPIINAGDGSGEHPSQALLDGYTIRKEIGRLHDIHIVMVGDLHHGRTARSLTLLLAKLSTKYKNIRITFVAPKQFQMRADILTRLDKAGVQYEQTDQLYPAITQADVVYQTRIQKERLNLNQKAFRFTNWLLRRHLDRRFAIGLADVRAMKPTACLMHPFPRNQEVAVEVDDEPQAAYFRQMKNGETIRMAILEWAILGWD